ncbi:solute carrier family 35 member G1-like [Neocloeon triangulifer]|uniref:solute carrier family 35 member G1-like n=1 Tax=Neocloeon triangulifer TaxID=2078957 RepID=UPI00286F74F6|nr:solute carrier family 35 member G1-like [Neocloeon triangulifer]
MHSVGGEKRPHTFRQVNSAENWAPASILRRFIAKTNMGIKKVVDNSSSPNGSASERESLSSGKSTQSNYSTIAADLEVARKIKEDLGPPVPFHTNWWAILLTFLSGVSFTLSSGLVKGIELINPMELLALRSAIQIFAMAPMIACKLINPFGPPGYRLYLLLQGFVGGITLVALFVAFRKLPLGDATSIIFSAPIFVMLMSFIFLREPCGTFRFIIAFLLITGVILVSRPPFIFNQGDPAVTYDYDIVGYSSAVLGALFSAVNIVLMRKCKDVHFSVLILYFSVGSFVISLALSFIEGPWTLGGSLWNTPLIEWGYGSLVGVTGLLGQVLLVIALNMEGAGKVAVTRSLDIVLAFVLQVCYWGQFPDIMGSVGSVLICICVAAMGVEEQFTLLCPDSWPCCLYSW